MVILSTPYGCLVPPHHDRHSSRARDTRNAQTHVQLYGRSVNDTKGSRGDLPRVAPSMHKYPVSIKSCPRQPRTHCPLCPQVRVEWDRAAHAIGRLDVCNELGERVGWVRVRKVAPCMCCARPLAHAFCSAFQLGAKTGAKGLPTGTAQLQPARKKFIAELRATISDRSSCTAAWRPALLLSSSAACWTSSAVRGTIFLLLSYFR